MCTPLQDLPAVATCLLQRPGVALQQNQQRLTALDVAHRHRHASMAALLEAAGVKPRPALQQRGERALFRIHLDCPAASKLLNVLSHVQVTLEATRLWRLSLHCILTNFRNSKEFINSLSSQKENTNGSTSWLGVSSDHCNAAIAQKQEKSEGGRNDRLHQRGFSGGYNCYVPCVDGQALIQACQGVL